ncbi:MAG: glycosyltransferase family 2 protein [Flavobacteriales bacterium]|jgi:glycosyltransferase involved in cell wall biosynthesis|nr:glycosyltransferase family 2 protein [Flavobacteriales bacterium]|tara:strand:- start:1166 stop:1861 length:696 start_codon:yes stop_codon:yes gene_type:complete
MKLSIIIPVYNEENNILEVISKVKRTELKDITKEIVIVDDFSTDNTKKILSELKDSSLKIFFHQKNRGKGTAIRTALKHATGDIILIQDADLEYNPIEYAKLLKPIMENRTKVVYGSRIEAIRENIKNMYKLHYLGNMLLTAVTNILYGTKITDMETGYKVFRKEVIENMNLKAKRFDFEPEITAKILKKGYKITEIPINFVGRKFNEGKKITWKDGIKAVFYLIKYRIMD